MRFYRPSLFVRSIYPKGIFRIPGRERLLFLTFDDGPAPGSTENILGILARKETKAAFFCSGNQAVKHPELMLRIRSEGHVIGNHGYYHLDGFRTILKEYCDNIRTADELTSSLLFRPPYGRLTPGQYRVLKDRYLLVFWDVMAYDFDTRLPAFRSLGILKRKIRPGSIIVLHDTSESSVHAYLEEFIDYALLSGYTFNIHQLLNLKNQKGFCI